jgi:hypothetical protein
MDRGIHYFKRCEFEIIDTLKEKHSVTYLCKLMNVNRFGYYKWHILTGFIIEIHKKHKSYNRRIFCFNSRFCTFVVHCLTYQIYK